MGRHSREDPDNEGTTTMLTAAFWTGAADRALKSAAQSLLLLWGADSGLNILEIEPLSALGVAAGAAVLSVLTSIASGAVGEKGTSSALPGAR